MASDRFSRDESVVLQPSSMNNPPGYASTSLPVQDPRCLPGLEYLIPLDKIFINQHIKPWRWIAHPNRYTAVDENQQSVYAIHEKAEDWFSRTCIGGTERTFEISFVDVNQRQAIRLEKEFKYLKSEILVYNGDTFLGLVKRPAWTCVTQFHIFDESGILLYRIFYTMCPGGCEPVFTISDDYGTEIGTITKHWAGFKREFYTDIFGVTFPVDTDVRHKALLLAAAIHIDFSFYEKH